MMNIRKDIRKDIMLEVAWSFIGRPYRWGGDDPIKGFDCSGLVIECLKSVGILPRKGDWTAQGLWGMFKDKQTDKPCPGCLVFWENKNGKVIHVELCLTDTLSIGASGGSSRTRSLDDAVNQNAFIKIRPFGSRKGLKGFVNPFKD